MFSTKLCQECKTEWLPTTRYQASRNKFCSKKCAGTSRSRNYSPKEGDCKCRVCGEIKTRVVGGIWADGRRKYVTKDGRRWFGLSCPDCENSRIREVKISRGKVTPRNMTTNKKHKKGYDAEVCAKRYFESIGFRVEQTSLHGPDLVLDGLITVEVKTISKIKRGKYYEYVTSPIKETRVNDDIVAVVYSNKKIMLEDMESFLKNSRKDNMRNARPMLISNGVI